jgi:hypothetical protein
VRPQPRQEHEIAGSVSDDLVGDVDVAALRISRLRHGTKSLPVAAWSGKDPGVPPVGAIEVGRTFRNANQLIIKGQRIQL